jgi:hypothetical protein
MAFIAILKENLPEDQFRIVATEERLAPPPVLHDDGTFSPSPDPVLFQREVPDPQAVLAQLHGLLATSKVEGSEDSFTGPIGFAIRAIELSYASLWPTRRLRCPECHQYFMIPYDERRAMYLACPNCHNPLLNPAWDSA